MTFRTIIVLAALAWAGCNPIEHQAEEALERKLTEVIGPAERYEADIEGLNALSGEAERVSITGDRVQPEDSPVLVRLQIDLHGVRYDRETERIEHVDRAEATAVLTPQDLSAFLVQHRNVEEASITLSEPDQASIRLRPTLAGFNLPGTVNLEGRIVADTASVLFDVSRLSALGVSLSGSVMRQLSEEINPVLDLSEIPARLRIKGVRVQNGAIHIQATGNPTGLKLAGK